MADYLSQITNGAQIMGPDGLMYTIGQNPNQTYNLSYMGGQGNNQNILGYVGLDKNLANNFFQNGSSAFGNNTSAYTPQFGIGDPMAENGMPLTQGYVATNPQQTFGGGSGGPGGFGTPSSKQLGNNTPGVVKSLLEAGFGLLGGALLGPALGPLGLGLGQIGSGVASGALTGAGSAFGQGADPLRGGLVGGVGGGVGAYLSPFNALSDAFPETIGSINPFSASNVSSPDVNFSSSPEGYGPNLPSEGGFSPGGMSLPGGISAPGSLASPSSSVSFGPSAFGSSSSPFATGSALSANDPLSALSGPGIAPSSTPIPGGLSGINNVSGAAQPSIFDNLMQGNVSDAASGIGNYAINNPLTTGLGVAGLAGAANQAGLFGSGNSPSSSSNNTSLLAPPFNPSEQSPMTAPGSLQQYSSLDPFQQATNIATQGVYGRGNGPQENSYFLNLLNRQLFDQGGNLAANTNSINPIENSYLSQLGITGQNPTDILKGISQYGT